MITASALGVSSAPNTPCSARPATSTSIDGASAQSTRHDAEAADADREDPPLAVEVAERAGDEDQRAERQQVGVGHPLLAGEPAAEVVADRRQRDVDHGRVEARDERAHDRGQRARGACGVRSRDHATEEGPASAEAVAGGPLPAADSKRRGPEPPGVLSAASAPEGAVTASERRASQPLGLALCGSVPRRGATYGRAPTRGQGPLEGDPANTGDFRLAVARPRTLGRAADRGRRGERARHRRAPSAS